MPRDGIKLHLGRAKAPETDLGETVDVYTTYGGIVVDLTSRLGLRLDYTRDKRKESYVRRAVSVSLTVRF